MTVGEFMKKISIILVLLTLILCNLFGCKSVNPLYNRVSELRENIFVGSCECTTIKAGYGFRETPFNNDKKVSERVYLLDFRLLDKESQDVSYNINFTHNGKIYSANFKLDPIKDTVCASVEIEDFNVKEFTVTLSFGGEHHEVLLKSIVPENTISYKTALDHLYNSQDLLVKNYTDENGNFNAEIYVRIVVKDEKSYWYVGIASGNERIKAMLIDGFNGEILAIREVF